MKTDGEGVEPSPFASNGICVDKNTNEKGGTPPSRVCANRNTPRGGVPLLVASVWIETRQEGGYPSRHVCMSKNTNEKGISPSRRVCTDRNTNEKGGAPSRRVCMDRNTNERG